MFMKDVIPDLKITRTAGKLIVLEQSDGGEGARIDIHPLHVRYIAEQFGLVPTCDLGATTAIEALQRRIGVLRDRARHLHEWMVDPEAQARTGQGYGVAYAEASRAMADEFCADQVQQEPPLNPTQTKNNLAGYGSDASENLRKPVA